MVSGRRGFVDNAQRDVSEIYGGYTKGDYRACLSLNFRVNTANGVVYGLLQFMITELTELNGVLHAIIYIKLY